MDSSINHNDKERLNEIDREAELAQARAKAVRLTITASEKQRLSKQLKLDFEALALDSVTMEMYKSESHKLNQASLDGLKSK